MDMVGEPKPMCPKHSEAKPMGTSEFRAEKGLLITEAPAWVSRTHSKMRLAPLKAGEEPDPELPPCLFLLPAPFPTWLTCHPFFY